MLRKPKKRAGPWCTATAFGAALLAVLLVPASARAYAVRETTTGAPVHWATADVTLELDPTLLDAVPDADLALENATREWSAAGMGPTLSLTRGTGSEGPAVDGRNVVYFAAGGYPQAGEALAITIVSYDDDTGEIVDTDIVVNGLYSFAILAATARAAQGAPSVSNDPTVDSQGSSPGVGETGPFDLVHVLTHETGHVLGLLDAPEEPSDVMFVYTVAGDASRRTPTSDDLAGISFLYADTAPTRGGCSASPRGPSREGHGLSSVAALGAAVLFSAERRRRR